MKALIGYLCFFAICCGVETATAQCSDLQLYYSPYCYYSQKVLNYLKGIHKTVPLKDVMHDAGAKTELLRQGGKPQVPCLFIDGYPLYESDNIITWLSEHKECLEDSSKP